MPVVLSTPQLIVTDPVPATWAATAVELAPVVVTLGQPPTSAEPTALNALAIMPAPLAVTTVPVRTEALPVNACAIAPYPPGVVPPLVEVVMLPAVIETVPPLPRIPRSPVVTLPTTILYDSQSREVWRVIGGVEWDDAEMAKLLREAD